MRVTFGLALIAWGLAVLFILPEVPPTKLMNFIILGTYSLAIVWWAYQEYPWWCAYWCAACAITLVVTFGDLTVR